MIVMTVNIGLVIAPVYIVCSILFNYITFLLNPNCAFFHDLDWPNRSDYLLILTKLRGLIVETKLRGLIVDPRGPSF